MPHPVDGDARYMSGLDGLRALAVLAVIAYHLNFGWAQGGLLGVGVFFVLSGYLITDLLLSQRERTGRIWLGRFWLRRARRLLPALWVMLAVVAVWVSLVQPEQLAALRQDVVAAFAYASNWWYVFQHISYFASFGPPSPLGHLWSLAVEEQFYVVWPLLLIIAVRFVRRRQVLVVLVLLGVVASALAMAALYQAGGNPNRMYYGTDTRAFELLIGASLALVWPSRRVVAAISRRRRAALDAVGVSGLAVIALMVVYTNQYQPFVYQGGLVLLSLAAAALVVALTHPLT
ncbi:MAG: acyltransferase, partial [Chloroflexi bacterium]